MSYSKDVSDMRERSQLVIVLGQGEKGERIRTAIDRVAKMQGKKVSAWARDQLLLAIAEFELETGASLLSDHKKGGTAR